MTTPHRAARRVARARILYPAFLSWCLTVAVVMMITRGWLTVGAGIMLLSVAATFDVVLQLRREVVVVHELVNSEHAHLVSRVDQLTDALARLGAPVPPNPDGGP